MAPYKKLNEMTKATSRPICMQFKVEIDAKRKKKIDTIIMIIFKIIQAKPNDNLCFKHCILHLLNINVVVGFGSS